MGYSQINSDWFGLNCSKINKVYKFYFLHYSMPKKDGEGYIISETGNWNVADQFSKSKIMRPLNLCDYYEDIACFGYESIAEELINFQAPPNDVIRIKAIQRLTRELIRVINNAKFALKVGNTKSTALRYKEQLIKLQKTIPNLVKVNKNRIEKTTIIKITNQALFDEILGAISEIKSKINEPLNKNHLIFTDKEEFDPKAFKKNLKERMISQG